MRILRLVVLVACFVGVLFPAGLSLNNGSRPGHETAGGESSGGRSPNNIGELGCVQLAARVPLTSI